MKTLSEWLVHLEKIHPLSMDFKLSRIQKVYERLNINKIAPTVITVAGTNGKGSTSTTIAAIFHEMDLKVGLYNSPHIHQFNERITINGCNATDSEIIQAFETIERTREDITLTYFEFATLAAFYLFHKYKVDIAVLEVGLGGRLDATNIVDADIAVITPIGIDHTEQLGNTITEIAREKAGIIKDQKIVISAEEYPDPIISDIANNKQCQFFHLGRDFKYCLDSNNPDHWQFKDNNHIFTLNTPKLRGVHQYQNTSTAIKAALSTPFGLKITEDTLNKAISKLSLKGRFDCYTIDHKTIIFDVTHNVQGAMVLKDLLEPYTHQNQKITAVFGMLKDKDCTHVGEILENVINMWILCPLSGDRGQSSQQLLEKLTAISSDKCIHASSVSEGCEKAINCTEKNDIMIIFGSFHTVSEGYEWFNTRFGL